MYDFCRANYEIFTLKCSILRSSRRKEIVCDCLYSSHSYLTPSFAFEIEDIYSGEDNSMMNTSITPNQIDDILLTKKSSNVSDSEIISAEKSSYVSKNLHLLLSILIISMISLIISVFLIFKYRKNIKRFTEKRFKFFKNSESVNEL